MDKKPFRETKLGKFLTQKVPKVLDKVGDFLPDKGLLGIVKQMVDNDPDVPDADKLEFNRLLLDHEREMFALEISDRDSARDREAELAKANRTDHLMYVAGYVAMGTFISMVASVIYASIKGIPIENSLFHQLMGIIEGVALSVFGYYFGASKGSRDKNAKLS